MVELWPGSGIVAAMIVSIVVPFVVLPEVLERRGYNPRSAFVRGIVWASFLVIILIPAGMTGFLSSVTNPADWLLFIGSLAVAILWDYFRLNPEKIPRFRSRN